MSEQCPTTLFPEKFFLDQYFRKWILPPLSFTAEHHKVYNRGVRFAPPARLKDLWYTMVRSSTHVQNMKWMKCNVLFSECRYRSALICHQNSVWKFNMIETGKKCEKMTDIHKECVIVFKEIIFDLDRKCWCNVAINRKNAGVCQQLPIYSKKFL